MHAVLRILALTVGVLLTAAAVHAAPIGQVIAVEGEATATRASGQAVVLRLKSAIHLDDTVVTKAGAKVQIMFADDTVISQGENSQMLIDKYVYSPADKEKNESSTKMVRGVFRLVTGKITKLNPERFKVKTGRATIGIRGTDLGFWLLDGREEIYVFGLHEREVIIDPDVGGAESVVMTEAGRVISVGVDGQLVDRAFTEKEAARIVSAATPAGGAKMDEPGGARPDGADEPGGADGAGGGDDGAGGVQPDGGADGADAGQPDGAVEGAELIRVRDGGDGDEAAKLEVIDEEDPRIDEADALIEEAAGLKTWEADDGRLVGDSGDLDRRLIDGSVDLRLAAEDGDGAAEHAGLEPIGDDAEQQKLLGDAEGRVALADEPVRETREPTTDSGGTREPEPEIVGPVAKFTERGGGEHWQWGVWRTDDVLDRVQVSGREVPTERLQAILAGSEFYNLSGVGDAGAVVAHGGKGRLLEGSAAIGVTVGVFAPSWRGAFSLANPGGDRLDFQALGSVQPNGRLTAVPTTVYSLQVDGQSFGAPSLTRDEVNARLVGPSEGAPPISGAIGTFVFEHDRDARVNGVFGADLSQP